MTDSTAPAPVRYDPAEIEQRWMRRWLDAGAFEARVDHDRPPFSIAIPPPNITGALHMGHALNGAIQDALCRYKRMQGYSVLWQPGTDHAGIATQNVVEKELRRQGLTRHDLGRERFLERVQEWRREYGGTIYGQFRRLGLSLDYARERFTMDEGYVKAVLTAFVSMYDKGFIYRDNYLVNWCGRCHTAISDLEVRQAAVDDEMVHVDYPLVEGDGQITVATVRPETIPADVAIAVHPNDERYAGMVGKHVRVPLTDREVPVITDEYVDPEFGTGVLKITPGHDQNDFEIGLRHGLPQPSAIEPDLTMSDVAGRWVGMPIREAKAAMVNQLDADGVLRSREHYRHSVPHCDRCGTRIEPLVSLQWFADMKKLAQPALQAARSGEVRFIPAGAANIFYSWMENLRPWCLSRQLWWGHRLPVWYCENNGEVGHSEVVHVSLEGPDAPCPDCGEDNWFRDEDVLDTWFSSGMWTFATLGWPDDTPELRYFHPTTVLSTAREIINLWVARMMMFSYEFLGEKPFSDVYIHSVVQAPDGRRMSKSLGTGIDPLDLIDRYGADATRYGLLTMSSTQDVRFNDGKIREGRDLANKLWNASRLLLMFGDASHLAGAVHGPGETTAIEDRWLLSRLVAVVEEADELLARYDFAMYTRLMYSFIWSEYCDWYLEAVKPRLRGSDEEQRVTATTTLAYALHTIVRLLHPIMPHFTEEIAEQVWGGGGGLLTQSQWPSSTRAAAFVDAFAEAEFERVRSFVTQLRSLRSAAGVPPGETLVVSLDAPDGPASVYVRAAYVAEALANVRFGEAAGDSGVAIPLEGATATVYGLDPVALRGRLEQQLADAEGEVRRAEGKLSNERFVSRAPAELVSDERAKVQRFAAQADGLRQFLRQLG